MKEQLLFFVTPLNDVTRLGRQQPYVAVGIVFDDQARRLTMLTGHGTRQGLRSQTAGTLMELLDFLSAELQQAHGFPMPPEVRENFFATFRDFTRGLVPDAPS
ncbi:MAG: hypothetical protein G01um101431_764 [Parcubacteria group bacterium Gr01-1014_31]|nr:MAG: hypothetical protein G01um101431_764 [Parcubacteria group bacterium Gr01-1014_31]